MWITLRLSLQLRHDRLASFTNSKALFVLESDRGDEFDLELNCVAWHNHLYLFRQSDFAGDVRCADIELRLVTGKERRVRPPSSFSRHRFQLRTLCEA